MAVYGYVRVSTGDQVNGTSLDEQERKVRGVAMVRGEDLAEIFREEGVTGSRPLEDRTAGAQLLARLRPGDTVIVAKLDRAFRNAADALTKADAWRKGGISLVIADMGTDAVTENGTSKMFFGMLALVAEFERERILERTAEGRSAKRAKGGHIGGTAPFGYRVEGVGKDAQLIPIPEQQEAMWRMVEMRQGGASLRAIAAEMISLGHRISHEGVRNALAAAGARQSKELRGVTAVPR
ncbi:recombinase family protein [Azospirillum sp. B2RO_4]|uniref:recombinase family protein n=1 Tax=Azospirillum sp. B2RO_4 TaxID=3027796 RepID=UPI003DAA07B8